MNLTLCDRQGKTALGVAARANEVIIVDMIIKAERYYAWRQHSYKEHGNRMLLIWLHGEELTQRSPAKELYQALVHTGNGRAADKIRTEDKNISSKSCRVS
uniref:Ankyrin repeat and death domain containing 1B n=1 Tax=Nothobranchius kuhntae TaxID=321403 RepID=A0A1A8ITC9_NOTKU